MLKSRIITAIFLISGVLACIFYAPLEVQAVMILSVCLGMGYEWLRMIGANAAQKILFYSLLLICAVIFYLNPYIDYINIAVWISAIGWVFAFITMLSYQKGKLLWSTNLWFNTLIGLWLIVPFGAGAYFLLSYFLPKVFLGILLVIACADSFAYFSGRICNKFGSHHLLSSRVSPGKSWEGVFGGMICTAIVLLIMHFTFAVMPWQYIPFMVFVIIPVSIVGDLFESMVKRIHNIKDSGNILPGHGGLLDRLDSLTAAVPIFIWCAFLVQRGGY